MASRRKNLFKSSELGFISLGFIQSQFASFIMSNKLASNMSLIYTSGPALVLASIPTLNHISASISILTFSPIVFSKKFIADKCPKENKNVYGLFLANLNIALGRTILKTIFKSLTFRFLL